MQSLTLAGTDGLQIPLVGLGTWRAPAEEIENSLEIALKNGYRHIDTAFAYYNEEAIGNVLKKWIDEERVKRSDLFITTKLPGFGSRAADVDKFLSMSLKNLKLDYVDLYLIHIPFASVRDESSLKPVTNEDGSVQLDFNNNNVETWKEMEKQVRAGRIKAIGLSNFNAEQVKEIYDQAEIKPSVLQVEMNAYLPQKELVNACKEMNVIITAYSPLGSPGASMYFSEKYNMQKIDFPKVLEDALILELATKYNKTPGQILLRSLTQQNITVIPKSGNPERIKQNINIFDFSISTEDLQRIDALDKGENARIFKFLFYKDVLKHPHYPFLKE